MGRVPTGRVLLVWVETISFVLYTYLAVNKIATDYKRPTHRFTGRLRTGNRTYKLQLYVLTVS